PSLELSTLSLHDALPIFPRVFSTAADPGQHVWIGAGERTIVLQRRSDGLPVVFTREPMLPKHCAQAPTATAATAVTALVEILERSEEHTSELQSRENLVC